MLSKAIAQRHEKMLIRPEFSFCTDTGDQMLNYVFFHSIQHLLQKKQNDNQA